VPGFGEFRLQGETLAMRLDRFVESPLLLKGIPQVVPRDGISRLKPKRLFHGRFGFFGIACLKQRVRKIVEQLGCVGAQGDSALITGNCLDMPATGLEQEPERVQHLGRR